MTGQAALLVALLALGALGAGLYLSRDLAAAQERAERRAAGRRADAAFKSAMATFERIGQAQRAARESMCRMAEAIAAVGASVSHAPEGCGCVQCRPMRCRKCRTTSVFVGRDSVECMKCGHFDNLDRP